MASSLAVAENLDWVQKHIGSERHFHHTDPLELLSCSTEAERGTNEFVWERRNEVREVHAVFCAATGR